MSQPSGHLAAFHGRDEVTREAVSIHFPVDAITGAFDSPAGSLLPRL